MMASRRERALLGFLFIVVVFQLAVPAAALFHPPPARFGFQMYSGVGGGSIVVRDAGGRDMVVDFADLFPDALRAELDWSFHVPQYLCANVVGAAEVRVQQDNRPETVTRCD